MKVNITNDCYAVGDIHGQASLLTDVLSYYDIKNCTLILLGDIGIWRYRDYKAYRSLDKFAAERNIMIYAFRGNHDNPAFFSDSPTKSTLVTRFWDKFTNFKVLPDLSILDINGHTGIVIGGGVSIDRAIRRSFQSLRRNDGNLYKNNDWWANETLCDTTQVDTKVDFILSHTGPRPTRVSPLSENNCSFFKLDEGLKDAIIEENEKLESIYKQFLPKKWWFGHFHINDTFDYYATRCYAVDIMNLTPIQF